MARDLPSRTLYKGRDRAAARGKVRSYLLLWVVLAANLIAMLIQTQSAKLGIATANSAGSGIAQATIGNVNGRKEFKVLTHLFLSN